MSPVLNTSKLKTLYATLLKCRLLNQQITSPARAHARPESAVREEAVVVGAAFDLQSGDHIVPSPRAALAEFVRRQSLRQVLKAEAAQGVLPRPQMRIGIALGMALALDKQAHSKLVLALGGIELTDERGWAEAVNFVGIHKLPVVYVIAHATGRDLRTEQGQSTLPCITVDGTDVVAVYRVMQESMRRARQGHGSTVIEARLGASDPLSFMENYLRARNLWSDVLRDRVNEDFKREIHTLQVRAKRRPS